MRPTDENQPGSRRPNLMSSSRRSTGEINILAMLDGQAPGRRLLAVPAVFWYGAAGVLACSLLAALAWLVRGATPARDAQTADTAQAATAPAVRSTPAMRDAGSARDGQHGALPGTRAVLAEQGSAPSPVAPDTYAPPPARGAVVIDLPQPTPAAAPTPAPPASAATASATPGRASALAAASRPQPTAPRHAVAHATTSAVPPARPQPAYRATPAQPSAQTPSLAHVHPGQPGQPTPSRQKRAAGAGKTAPAPGSVDTDVALISAILQHTGTRDEATEGTGAAACTDKPCGARMPSRQ